MRVDRKRMPTNMRMTYFSVGFHVDLEITQQYVRPRSRRSQMPTSLGTLSATCLASSEHPRPSIRDSPHVEMLPAPLHHLSSGDRLLRGSHRLSLIAGSLRLAA